MTRPTVVGYQIYGCGARMGRIAYIDQFTTIEWQRKPKFKIYYQAITIDNQYSGTENI